MKLLKKLALSVLLVIPACRPVLALTLSDIKIQVRRMTSDKADPGLKMTDAELLSYINEAQRQVVSQTWCLSNRTSQAITVNTTYYNLPTDLMAITHVEFKDVNNHTRELTEVSERATQQDNFDYERITGTPMTYFVRGSTSSASYQMQICFLPIASSSTAAGTALIDYVNQATDLSADTDVPFDGQRELYPYHYTIVYLASSMAKAVRSDPSAAMDLQLAQAYVKLMLDRLGQMPNYNPGFRPGGK